MFRFHAISTGSISLDYALGVGGFPRGRICEIFGPESSGKTTIALQVVAEAQKAGGMAAFIDVEHALDPIYAKKLGVDVDNLLVSQPDYAEQALEITSALISSGFDRRAGRRLCRGTGSQSRTRRRNGRCPHGRAGAPDVAGHAQADRHRLEIEYLPDLHQPDPRKDRRHVRQSGNHHRAAAR